MAKDRERDPFRAIFAGAIAGFVASWVMNEFQGIWNRSSEMAKEREWQRQKRPVSEIMQPPQQSGSEDATQVVANKIAEYVLQQPLTKEQKVRLAPAVHYAFGAGMGAAYGLISEYFPRARSGFGLLFGTALFLGADESMLPLLGLSRNPGDYPLSVHAYAWASHLVFGAATEVVDEVVRRAA